MAKLIWLGIHTDICIFEQKREIIFMITSSFEWDENKNKLNQKKHNLSFEEAQYAFHDNNRIIARDLQHSKSEERFYCFGKVDDDIITVRFTYRNNKIRIIGAGYWRKGK